MGGKMISGRRGNHDRIDRVEKNSYFKKENGRAGEVGGCTDLRRGIERGHGPRLSRSVGSLCRIHFVFSFIFSERVCSTIEKKKKGGGDGMRVGDF
jgi:hypothetical protein